MINFGNPITLQLSSRAKEEFHICEYGSYEDFCRANACGLCNGFGIIYGHACNLCLGKGYKADRFHVVEILERDTRKTRLRIDDNGEAETVFVAIASGTLGIRCPGTALRLYDELAPYVPDDVKARWPRGRVCL